MNKGSECSKEGKRYEEKVHSIVSKTMLNNKLFNTQKLSELGGCNINNDIECNFKDERDLSIEIKKNKSPDWMQCVIQYSNELNKWICSSRNRIPDKSKKIFEKLIEDKNIFNGKIPPFVNNKITHEEWLKIKKETKDFCDVYFECPSDTIKKLYRKKGNKYIQISGKGLYHLGKDVCEFNVPEFICDQVIRIRTKIHTRKNKQGYCSLSVTVSCKPNGFKSLQPSLYSLDSEEKLPTNLKLI